MGLLKVLESPEAASAAPSAAAADAVGDLITHTVQYTVAILHISTQGPSHLSWYLYLVCHG